MLTDYPCPQSVDTLLTHLTTGFDIGYQGPHLDLRAPNLASAFQHPSAIDNYLHSECKQGRMAGPFDEPPFSPFHCSGMGVVPKQDGSWRVITHLSAPEGGSINDFIDPEAVTLKYITVDNAINLASQLGRGTLFAKIDMAKAFRQCPVRAADWHLLGLQWRGKFYYDKCLPFSLRSSPFLFNTVATALEYIIKSQLNTRYVLHYLDDFLFAGPPDSHMCGDILQGAEALCECLGVQVKPEKRTSPTACITFLGIELDTVAQIARVPHDKLSPLLSDLHEFHSRHKCTKRELLSLIGRLAFTAKVIPAGRMFLRRLIEASTTVTSLHHHLRITKPIRADLDWWLTFASQWNGKAFFLDHDWTPSPAFQLFTDASQLGYGCYWRGHWLYGPWSRQRAARDIQWKELFAILVAATVWASHWRRKRLLVHCDNQAVVDICRTGTSKNTELMRLIRTLFFTAARHNFTLLINHIPGVDNSVADALSRLQFHRFHQLAPEADPEPTPTPVIVISH